MLLEHLRHNSEFQAISEPHLHGFRLFFFQAFILLLLEHFFEQ